MRRFYPFCRIYTLPCAFAPSPFPFPVKRGSMLSGPSPPTPGRRPAIYRHARDDNGEAGRVEGHGSVIPTLDTPSLFLASPFSASRLQRPRQPMGLSPNAVMSGGTVAPRGREGGPVSPRLTPTSWSRERALRTGFPRGER